MKILYINKYFWLKGGAETVYFLDRESAIEKGCDVIDFSMQHPRNYKSKQEQYFISNIDYHEQNSGRTDLTNKAKLFINMISNREALTKLAALIAKEKPDIAHLHNIYHQLSPAIIPLLNREGIKIILTLHDYKLICPSYLMINKGKICEKCLGGKFYNATIQTCKDDSMLKGLLLSLEAYWHEWKKSYEMVDLVLSPSQFLANLVESNRKDIKRIKVLKNGVDTNKLQPSVVDKNYALFFGRITMEKGVETLLKAYDKLFGDSKNSAENGFGLKFVGEGDIVPRLKEEYPNVEFMGYKTGDDLKKIVSESSFVVVPSEWYENCSMTVLESMAYGKAIIGSRIGGIPEQVEDGKNGLLFKMADVDQLAEKMSILINNAELRLEMGKNAREKVENEYSIAKHKERLFKFYDEMMYES
jgi:glycosyltransferase involved in cell wall biosynthesis